MMVSVAASMHSRRFNPTILRAATYTTNTDGLGIRFGIPVSELDTINLGLAVESNKIETFSNSPQRFLDFVNRYGSQNVGRRHARLLARWSRQHDHAARVRINA